MRNLLVLILLLYSVSLSAQKYYSRIFDPYHNQSEEYLTDAILDSTEVIVKGGARCISNGTRCTIFGKYSIKYDSFTVVKRLDDVQDGYKILRSDDGYIVSSQEAKKQKNISVSAVDKDFNYIKTTVLKLPQTRYYNYIAGNSIRFGDKYVISAVVEDSLDVMTLPNTKDTRKKTILFVVDKNLKLDTTIIVTPGSGYIMRIENLTISPDSILYISFYNISTLDQGARKIIYGYNKQFKKVFTWFGPDFYSYKTFSYLIVDKNNTIYTNVYTTDYETYLYALDPKGNKKWACRLDSIQSQGNISTFSLLVAQNGDIVGSAIMSSALNDIGQTGYMFRVSSTGKLKWNRVFRYNKSFKPYINTKQFGFDGEFSKIIELPDQSLMAFGRIFNFIGLKPPGGGSSNSQDFWIVKTDSTGCLWRNCPYIQDVVQKPKYLPIVTSRNEWVIDNREFVPIKPFNTTTVVYTSDSFLLDNKYYFKRRTKNSLITPGVWSEGTSYYREQNGIVYYKAGVNTPEQVLYNFNLGIGDTLPPIGSSGIRIVDKVLVVTYLDGIPRKKMVMKKPCDVTVVEGIGDVSSISSFSSCVQMLEPPLSFLRCFFTDGKAVYKAIPKEGCYTILAVKDVDVRINNIYPNPSTGLLNIDIEDPSSIKRIFITDNLGRTMNIQDHTFTDNGIQLSIEALQNGLYYGNIVFNDGSATKFKVIKVGE
jgi:hypothetical protein